MNEFKSYYVEGIFNHCNLEHIIEQVASAVLNDHSKDMLLNLIYFVVVNLNNNIVVNEKLANSLSSIELLVEEGELSKANPLKFYWAMSKLVPKNTGNASQALKEIVRISVEGKKM